MTFKMFKIKNINKELSLEFKNKLIVENNKRFLLLLSLVAISQIIFLILELIGIMQWEHDVFIYRLIVMFLSFTFFSLIYFLTKKDYKNKDLKSLTIITSFIQFLSILVGCYFVVTMFNSGIYSSACFLLVAFIVSLTCVRNPYFSGAMIFLFFIGLTIYINLFNTEISIWIGEFLVELVFIFLLCIGNILNYDRHLKLFLQEKKIAKMNTQLELISETDSLTGIKNRRKTAEVIHEYISLAKRYKSKFCIAILDIDHFKSVNDNFGHNIGDDILRQFTKNIQLLLRTTDIFGRWGGEEFIILFPNCKQDDAFCVVERLRENIEHYDFPQVGQITFSAGIRMYNEENDSSELVEKADLALYNAKDMGRNQTQIYKINSI